MDATGKVRLSYTHIFVSIHASTWDATRIPTIINSRGRVSIHASTWDATLDALGSVLQIEFQSTHPHGMRPPALRFQMLSRQRFNPRIHMGCDFRRGGAEDAQICFNPRIHMGCDETWMSAKKAVAVSIHASTWDATHRKVKFFVNSPVSIHASTWDATGSLAPFIITSGVVSIHASTWDATPLPYSSASAVQCFNPRIHMGCDRGDQASQLPDGHRFNPRIHMGCDRRAARTRSSYSRFQSTHPHGMRLNISEHDRLELGFNPRIHMGCDSTAIEPLCSKGLQAL